MMMIVVRCRHLPNSEVINLHFSGLRRCDAEEAIFVSFEEVVHQSTDRDVRQRLVISTVPPDCVRGTGSPIDGHTRDIRRHRKYCVLGNLELNHRTYLSQASNYIEAKEAFASLNV